MKKGNIFFYFLLFLSFFFFCPFNLSAQNIFEIKVDTLENFGQKIYYCPSYDSLHLIAPDGSIKPTWAFHSVQYIDTSYQKDFYLPNGFEGQVAYTDTFTAQHNFKDFEIIPVTTDSITKNLSVACYSDINLSAESDFLASGNFTYSWSPETGLSSTNTMNTVAHIENDIQYTVFVTSDNGCTEKQIFNISLDTVPKPEICLVGLNDANKNVIYFDPSPPSSIDSIYVFKETMVTDVYEKIASLKAGSTGQFIDEKSFPDIQSNKYKMQVLDKCDRLSEMGEVHKTIHLAINQGQGNTWNLIWQPYEGTEVSTYYIYRGMDPDSMELIGSSSSSNTQYSDFSAPEGYVYYQIVIYGPANCGDGKKSMNEDQILISKSNMVTNNPHPYSVKDNFTQSHVNIYPNPAEDLVQIELSNASLKLNEIKVYDIRGKIVLNEPLGSDSRSFDISELEQGIYILKLKTNSGNSYYTKLLKK
ncbi:MAG: T9SS type A sorting domain-containing protein [Bacteroidota bacterium]